MATTLSIEKFVNMRAELLKEKSALESRLARVTAALESTATKTASQTAPASRRRTRARNKMSLPDAVLQVTRAKPLTRQEILAAIVDLGYKFTTKKPLNSLNTALYSCKAIKNYGGKFGPAK